MNGKNFAILCAAAGILILAAIFMSDSGKIQPSEDIGNEIFPALPINDITKLVIRSQDDTMEIVKQDNGWIVPEKYGYPADFSKVRTALITLSGLKVGQILTLDDVQKRHLKIAPPQTMTDNTLQEQTAGSLLELYRSDEKIASLLVGDTHKRHASGQAAMFGSYPDGQYVSPDNGQTVYLVGETLDSIIADPNDWLDSDLVNVPSADIVSATIKAPDTKPISLSRAKNGNLEVDNLPRKKTTDEAKARSVAGALSYLRFKDIADPSLPDSVTGMNHPTIFSVTTKKGEIYTVSVGGKQEGSDSRYVRIRAAFDSTAQPTKQEPETTANENQDASDPEKDLKPKIEALDKKLRAWTYIIESHLTGPMMYTENDLIKKEEKKKDK
ncbi:MAG: DUF4340 domain-containing protein [Lentisphaerae bacterium]|nr:DUF4340 domain-containing protein [Lentisphaerota bacterium]